MPGVDGFKQGHTASAPCMGGKKGRQFQKQWPYSGMGKGKAYQQGYPICAWKKSKRARSKRVVKKTWFQSGTRGNVITQL